jgi:hypothetical protein
MSAGKNHDLHWAGPGVNGRHNMRCLNLELSIVHAIGLQAVRLVDHHGVRITGENDAIQ